MKIKLRSQQKLNRNTRFQALIIIDQVMNQNAYSNVVVNQYLQSSPLSPVDNRLLVQLVYGVVQRNITLDYILLPYIEDKKLDDWVIILLKMSIYQLVFLDKIPEHAIVNEAVNIAKINGHQGLGKLVNAILRTMIRDKVSMDKLNSSLSDQDELTALSIKYSMPKEWIMLFNNQLSHDQLVELLESTLEIPHVSVRINPRLSNRDDIISLLKDEKYDVEESAMSDYGIRIKSGNILRSKAYKLGLITVQDESSMLVAPLGNLEGNEMVLDACTAPGGKATHIASLLDTGHLTGLDIYENKIDKVTEHMERMKLMDRTKLYIHDASTYDPEDNNLYDRIYLDAPCSGLGLIRRKPEIKYRKTMEDIVSLVQVQKKLIAHLSSLLKPGGILIYSTCTLTLEENEQLLFEFIQEHNEFKLMPINLNEVNTPEIVIEDGFIRIWPNQFQTDGFFIGRMIKEGKSIEVNS